MANYSSNCRSTHLRRDWFSGARLHAEIKKRGREGGKEFGIPVDVTEVEDARAIVGERERKKMGRKKESVKMRDIED